MAVPREVFEELMEPLAPEDVEGLQRDSAGALIPTKTTATLRYYAYSIRKGSVSDKLFQLHTMDAPPPPKKKEAEVAAIGEENVYEVEEILDSRKKGH